MTRAHTAAAPGWHLHRIPTPDGTLAVAEYRGVVARDAEPLVLLHGFTGSHRSWDAVAPALAVMGRCVAVDLPGHGDSDFEADAGVYSMERTSAAVEGGLDALHAGPATLIGYSMGGRLALYFALTRPERVRRLVLESASPGLPTEADRAARRRSDEDLARFVLDRGIEAFVDRWESVPVLWAERRLPLRTRARLRQDRMRSSPAGLAASLRGMGLGRQPWLGDRLSTAAMPVLLMAGKDDPKFVAIARSMTRCLPDATLAIIPGAGHNVHLECEDEFVRLVGRFVSRRDSGATAAERRKEKDHGDRLENGEGVRGYHLRQSSRAGAHCH